MHNKFKKTKIFVFVSNLFCILGGIFYTIYYLYYLSSAYISLLIQDELQYSVEFANIAYLVFSIAMVLLLSFLFFMNINSKTAYLAGMLTFILLTLIGMYFKMRNPMLDK